MIPASKHTESIREILKALGADVQSEDMLDTPRRWIKAMAEMMDGYNKKPSEVLTMFPNDSASELVILQGIQFTSLCAHHCLPFEGTASVAYVPGEKIVGLSKLARIVDIFAHRLQVQEQLTQQIANALYVDLQAKGSFVVVRAEHACMRCRGIRKQGAVMVTEKGYGSLRSAKKRKKISSLLEGME
jgi:GTP cyclohydrolase I